MNNAEKWATAVMVADKILNNGCSLDISIDPKNLVLQGTQNVILFGEPSEYFSKDMPVFVPEIPADDSLKPIDILYGRYIPGTHTIEIFIKNIEQDAHLFSCKPAELTCIVRIHEYAHAVLHTGVGWRHVCEKMSIFNPDGRTDWENFIKSRNMAYSEINTYCHELLAQAVTYSSISKIPDTSMLARLIKTFNSLEKMQPSHYKLSPELKEVCKLANWSLVFDAARGQIVKHMDDTSGLYEGISALIKKTAEQVSTAGHKEAFRCSFY